MMVVGSPPCPYPRRSVMTRRMTVGVLLFGAAAVALVSLQRPEVQAAPQKGNAAALQQKILQLEQANAQLQQANAQLQQQVKQLQGTADKTTKTDQTKDDKSKT